MAALLFIAISQAQTLFVTSPDSVKIAYEVRGHEEPALILVHGWSCDRTYWRGQIESFSKICEVVAIDLAGHGESGLGRKSWTIEAFGDDVAAVLKKLDIKHAILVGHSMGGDVIAEAAKLLPGRIRGLIMVDTYKKLGSGRSPEQVHAFVAKLRANFVDSARAFVRSMFIPSSDSTLVNWVVNDMSSAPPAVALGAVESAMSYSRRMATTLEELKLPFIAINPDNAPTDVASIERYGGKVMIMPGVGHFLMMEDPKRFNILLGEAVKTLAK